MVKLYSSQSDETKNKPAKESIPLNQVLGCAAIEGKTGLFRVTLPTGDRDFLAESDESRDLWISMILKAGVLRGTTSSISRGSSNESMFADNRENSLYSSVETFSCKVQVDQNDAAKSLGLPKNALLQVTPVTIRLCDENSLDVLASWPLRYLRRYGTGDRQEFYFEAGRKCPTGPGYFSLQSKKNHMIGEKLDHYTKLLSQQFDRGSSNSPRSSTASASPSSPRKPSPLTKKSQPIEITNAYDNSDGFYRGGASHSSPSVGGISGTTYERLNSVERITSDSSVNSTDSVYSHLGETPPRDTMARPPSYDQPLADDASDTYGVAIPAWDRTSGGVRIPYDTTDEYDDGDSLYADSLPISASIQKSPSDTVHYTAATPLYMDHNNNQRESTYAEFTPTIARPGEEHYDLLEPNMARLSVDSSGKRLSSEELGYGSVSPTSEDARRFFNVQSKGQNI